MKRETVPTSPKEWLLVGLLISFILLIVTLIAFAIWWSFDNQRDLQRKQDECLASGGVWFENRKTESYCYMEKK